MAHTFAAGQYAQIPSAAMPSASAGAFSVLAVIKRSANSPGANTYVVSICDAAGTASVASLGFNSSNVPRLNSAGGSRIPTTMSVTTTDNWVAIGVSKPAGAVVTPRFHKYVYGTSTASHENATATTIADFTLPGPTGNIVFSRLHTGVDQGAVGSYAAVGIFDRELTDQEFESAASALGQVLAAKAGYGAFVFDQSGTVVDLVGCGAKVTHTGTEDSAGSPLSYGHTIF